MLTALTKYTVLSVDTIRTRMLRKNSVKNTAQLISECYQEGILKVNISTGLGGFVLHGQAQRVEQL